MIPAPVFTTTRAVAPNGNHHLSHPVGQLKAGSFVSATFSQSRGVQRCSTSYCTLSGNLCLSNGTLFCSLGSQGRREGAPEFRLSKFLSSPQNRISLSGVRFPIPQTLSGAWGECCNDFASSPRSIPESQNFAPTVVSDTFFSGDESSDSDSENEGDTDSESQQSALQDSDDTLGSQIGPVKVNSEDEKQRSNELWLTEEEYTLTEEGVLSTVTLSVGGSPQKTRTNIDRIVAEARQRAESIQKVVREFSVRELINNLGKKKPGVEDLVINEAMYEPRDGVSNIAQWTATELTLQRSQMVRIARDTQYLVWAFSLFGIVRILETLAAVFSTQPPNPKRLMDAMNALDPLTVASLAHAMRKPVVGMLEVDPTNLQEVTSLKAKFWAELHKFYERQWKVMATLGIARLLALIATHLPSYEWVTGHVKTAWDISMALPIF